MQRRPFDLRLFDFRLYRAILLGVVFGVLTSSVIAQEPPAVQPKEPQKQPTPNKEELSPAPAKVDVQPVARDEEIRTRLERAGRHRVVRRAEGPGRGGCRLPERADGPGRTQGVGRWLEKPHANVIAKFKVPNLSNT